MFYILINKTVGINIHHNQNRIKSFKAFIYESYALKVNINLWTGLGQTCCIIVLLNVRKVQPQASGESYLTGKFACFMPLGKLHQLPYKKV